MYQNLYPIKIIHLRPLSRSHVTQNFGVTPPDLMRLPRNKKAKQLAVKGTNPFQQIDPLATASCFALVSQKPAFGFPQNFTNLAVCVVPGGPPKHISPANSSKPQNPMVFCRSCSSCGKVFLYRGVLKYVSVELDL